MLTTYFIAIRPRSNEHHTIHRIGCPFMPDDEKRIYLGDFISSHDALSAGKRHFRKSDTCRFCSKDQNPDDHRRIFLENVLPLQMMTLDKMSVQLENTLLCCVN
jgi:hypothetical protein